MTIPALELPVVADVQRRTLRLLFTSQVIGAVGMSVGMSVGALLAADMASVGVSGLAQSAAVMGAALLAVPAVRVARRNGRGPSLAAAYLTAAIGGVVVVAAAITRSIPLLFAGFFLFGAGTTAALQARYAAVDLAPVALYGRHLSLIVWASTVGGVAGPNLASLAGVSLGRYGVPTLAAPFVFSTVLFAIAAVLLFGWLRPDPLRLARDSVQTPPGAQANASATTAPRPTSTGGMRAAFHSVLAHRDARLGVAATAIGHVVMVAVMAMTPVHIRQGGHAAHDTLRIVGIVISLHVAGMFAFAPIMGWLSDRFGRHRTILGGITLLLAACAVSGTAGHDTTRLTIGLVLLGLGWSASMVAGSALLSVSMPLELRPSAQGLSDLVMGISAASAGALSGVIVQTWSYSMLTLIAALATIPLVALASPSAFGTPATSVTASPSR